jgi:hypothetical protein
MQGVPGPDGVLPEYLLVEDPDPPHRNKKGVQALERIAESASTTKV